jgi:hypothetical protein
VRCLTALLLSCSACQKCPPFRSSTFSAPEATQLSTGSSLPHYIDTSGVPLLFIAGCLDFPLHDDRVASAEISEVIAKAPRRFSSAMSSSGAESSRKRSDHCPPENRTESVAVAATVLQSGRPKLHVHQEEWVVFRLRQQDEYLGELRNRCRSCFVRWAA